MKTIIPYGDRILVKRRTIGDKLGAGIIVAADQTKERPTDIADVVYVTDHTFTDKELINNASSIIASLIKKAGSGDSDALISLLRFNDYLKIKSIKKGDTVMINKYVGIDFADNQGSGQLTLVKGDDIIAIIGDEK